MQRFTFTSAIASTSPFRGAGAAAPAAPAEPMDDDLEESGQGMETPSTPPAGQATTSPAAQTGAAVPPTHPPGDGSGDATPGSAAAGGAQAGQAGTTQQQDALLAFAERELGFTDLRSRFNDGASFLRALAAGYNSTQQQLQRSERERMQLMQRAMQPAVAPGAPAAGTPAQPDPLAKYRGPEWNPQWEGMVTQDEKGNLIPKPGVDPMIPAKIHAALNWRRQQLESWADNPVGFLEPILQHFQQSAIDKAIEERLNSRLGAYQEETYANQFVQSNSGWLFAYDQNNQVVTNPATGKPVMSAEGRMFTGFLGEAANRFKITDPRAREEYARAKLAAHVNSQLLQQHQAGQTGTTKQQQVVDQLNRRPNRGGSTVAGDNTGHTGATQNKSLGIAERLRQNFATAGVGDAAIADSEF